jgi:hypothetical protein
MAPERASVWWSRVATIQRAGAPTTNSTERSSAASPSLPLRSRT